MSGVTPEEAWRDCMSRRGTSGTDEQVAVARTYFMEGLGYGIEAGGAPVRPNREALIEWRRQQGTFPRESQSYEEWADALLAADHLWAEEPKLGPYDRTPPDLSVASADYWRGVYDTEDGIMAMLGIPIAGDAEPLEPEPVGAPVVDRAALARTILTAADATAGTSHILLTDVDSEYLAEAVATWIASVMPHSVAHSDAMAAEAARPVSAPVVDREALEAFLTECHASLMDSRSVASELIWAGLFVDRVTVEREAAAKALSELALELDAEGSSAADDARENARQYREGKR